MPVSPKPKRANSPLLPDPPQAPRWQPIISVDDHIVEPPWVFTNHIAARYGDRAPKVIELPDGSETWEFEGQQLPNVGFNAVAGRPVDEYSFDPTRFDQMRRGAWNITDRLADMSLDGSLCLAMLPFVLAGVLRPSVCSSSPMILISLWS